MMNNNKLEVAIGVLLVVTVGLVLVIALLTYTLSMGPIAELKFPAIIQAAFGQENNTRLIVPDLMQPPQNPNINETQILIEDPDFRNFTIIAAECGEQLMSPPSIITTLSREECAQAMLDGLEKWCHVDTYHEYKCRYVRAAILLQDWFVGTKTTTPKMTYVQEQVTTTATPAPALRTSMK